MSKFILSAFADEIDPSLKMQMDVLDKCNIKHIEMRGVNGRPLIDHSIEEVKEIKKQLDERGFKLSAIGSSIGKIKISDEFEPHLELFKHTLEISKIMETKYIRMFSFFIDEGHDANDYKDEVVRRWKTFIEIAKDYDVILLHENEKDIYGDTAYRCKTLLDELNCDFVKLTFDPANFVQCKEETYPKAYEVLKDYIEYMHIKDAKFDSGEVVPAGYGDGSIADILQDLKNRNYSGFLSLEPHLADFEGFNNLENSGEMKSEEIAGEKTFKIALDALVSIIENLKEGASI